MSRSKESMLKTVQTIWAHASPATRKAIKNIFSALMESAQVIAWEPTDKPNEYKLELAQEIVGHHPDIAVGQLLIKQKMKVMFLEEKIAENQHDRQIIAFPDKGISYRLGVGWLSKDIPLKRIFIEEKEKNEIWCTAEALGQNVAKPTSEALSFWKKMQWS